MKALKYKVTVSALIERTVVGGKEWARVSSEDKSLYAYTPEIEKTVTKEEEIFNQTVSELDMAALVLTVNGITPPTKPAAEWDTVKNGPP